MRSGSKVGTQTPIYEHTHTQSHTIYWISVSTLRHRRPTSKWECWECVRYLTTQRPLSPRKHLAADCDESGIQVLNQLAKSFCDDDDGMITDNRTNVCLSCG